MAKLKLVDEAVRKSVEEIKARHKRDILNIASRYDEHPTITFKDTGKDSFEANFEVESDELRREIDEYLGKSQS